MKNKPALVCTVLLLLSALHLYAGKYSGCAHSNKQPAAAKTTLADNREDDYDVKHLRFDLNVTDTGVFVWGNVTTTAQVTATGMGQYVFELNNLMIVDSAKVNGLSMTVTGTGSVRTITLPSALPAGAMFSAQIFYHGVPPPGGGFFNGLTHALSGAGTHMLYTVSDPWVAMVWWPSKQSATDKIDSVDMFVTVPDGVVDGSNGVLVSVDKTTTPGFWTYHWKTNYPIDYYLISLAVARYAEYRSHVYFTGSTDSMLVQNFFIDTATFNPAYKANFDSIGLFVDYFSSLFGRYPFWKEKYGVCYTNLPGGMEHQTMTTIGVPNTTTIAHELAHQWFGDNVTYNTWGDVWLSEGFATYAEQLYLSQFRGEAASKALRQSYLANILTAPAGMVYVNDTTTSDSLFHQPTVYKKGQGVVGMLRCMAPADSLFFKALRIYQQTYAYGNASTANLNAIINSVYGMNLDTFFQQWIYGRGYPIYTASWNQAGTTVFVKLIQNTSTPAYTPNFHTPLAMKLNNGATDTTVWVYNTADTQIFTFNWANPVTSVQLNPDAWTVCKVIGPIKKDTTLSTGSILPGRIRIFPNPTKNHWQVQQLPDDTRLTLTDMSGRILWQGKSSSGTSTIPGAQLPAGNYLLQLDNGNYTEGVQLTHW